MGPVGMERFGGAGYEVAAAELSRQQERHYRLLSELQELVKALPRCEGCMGVGREGWCPSAPSPDCSSKPGPQA